MINMLGKQKWLKAMHSRKLLGVVLVFFIRRCWRGIQKITVKPVQIHLIQLDSGLEDSDEDSDFYVNRHKTESDGDEDDIEGNESNKRCPVKDEDVSNDDDDDENSELVTDESGEESGEEKPDYFGMDVDEGDDDEDYVPKIEGETTEIEPQKCSETEKSPELSQTLPVDSSLVMSKARPIKVPSCSVCFGDISETDNECKNCGVAVHEGCYGISDNQSAARTESSASTEPWFCDAYKAGVRPTCELCPNKGGIFKETCWKVGSSGLCFVHPWCSIW